MTVYGVGISRYDLTTTINELDWQESVISRYDPTSSLPSSPSVGDRYISTATANGWTEKYIYEYAGIYWNEIIPNEGFTCTVEDENKDYKYNGSQWDLHTSKSLVSTGFTYIQSSASTTWTIPHGLGTKYVHIKFYDVSDDSEIIPTSFIGTSTSTATAIFSVAKAGRAVVSAPSTIAINSYLHDQTSSSTTWTVSHKLNTQYVVFTCYDSSDKKIYPVTETATDNDTLTLTFSTSKVGKVRVLASGSASVTTAGIISESVSNAGVSIADGLKLLAGLVVNRTATAANLTLDVDDYYIGVTSTAAARTITLPTAAVSAGKSYIIKDESGGALTNNITIDTETSETIDGVNTYVISSNYGSVTVICDGTNWFIV